MNFTRQCCLLLALTLFARSQNASADSCESLTNARIPSVTIMHATKFTEGRFASSDGEILPVPAFCRIEGEARPSEDSRIGFELWLPERNWNGRYVQLGNGGFAGRIVYPPLAEEIRRGNAVAVSDTGHNGDGFDASWASGHPQKIIDFGYRSIPATSDAARSLMRMYYRRSANRHYFVGCSNGGRMALIAAQRYPEAWDGIIAGSPVNDFTRQFINMARIQSALRSRADASTLILDTEAHSQLTLVEQFFRYFVYDDATWQVTQFDPRRDPDIARSRMILGKSLASVLDARNPNLERFVARGGKLLMYGGWADTLISPWGGIDYFERVNEWAKKRSIRAESFVRLFMIPGMGHCQGGAEPNAFGQAVIAPPLRDDAEHDIRRALEEWVEHDRAPERLIAVKYIEDDPARGVAEQRTLPPAVPGDAAKQVIRDH